MTPEPTDNTPSQQLSKALKPLVDFAPHSIDAWIGQLPLSDVDAACEAVHTFLRRLNMTDGLECLERQRIVEQVRPPAVSLLAMNSEKHLPATALFPLSAAKVKHTQRSIEICLELAGAYRRVITAGDFFSDKVGSDTGRAQIVYRALQAYGQALLRTLERYESPPEGFWFEVYSFYAFAEGHQLQYIPLPAPEIEGATVDSQFKQILLLNLSSHQHHVPDDIRQFYTALMFSAKEAVFDAEPVHDGETALYYFDLGTDHDPRPVKRAKPLRAGQRRYVFIRAMLANARQYFAQPSNRANERFKLRLDVILSLLDALAATEKRRFVRTSATGKRRIVVGLERIINVLSAEPASAAADGLVESAAIQMVDEDDMEEVEIVLDNHGSTGHESIWAKSSRRGEAAVQSETAIDLSTADLRGGMLNQSAGGYCLEWLNSSVPGARVGELIGLYEDDSRIHLGVIRWLHHKAKFELVLGVQLLSPVVEAVGIECGDAPAQRGLHFFANSRLVQPAGLLCKPGTFKVGQAVTLRLKNGEGIQFRLEKPLNTTLSFQLFGLTRI